MNRNIQIFSYHKNEYEIYTCGFNSSAFFQSCKSKSLKLGLDSKKVVATALHV